MRQQTQAKAKSTPTPSFTPVQTGLLQRKCACGSTARLDGQCAECRSKRLTGLTPPLVQTKLKIGSPNDKYEQEADRVADMVMRMPDPRVQRQVEPSEEEDEEVVQTKPVSAQMTPLLQRQVEPEEEEEEEEETLQTKPLVQRRATNQATPITAPPIVHDVLRSPGQTLDPAIRAYMEPRFGHDFSQVRVHTDARAAESAEAVNALAYTVGNDVVFGAGQYSVRTKEGRSRMAHELTHVVQQKKRIQLPTEHLSVRIKSDDVVEREADGTATSVISSERVHVTPKNISFQLQRIPQRRRPIRSLGRTPGQQRTTQPSGTSKPCPTSARLDTVRQFNHSNLPASAKARYKTYLGAISRINLLPGPDHTGNCMKEELSLLANTCPTSLTSRTNPCSAQKCLPLNRGGTDGPTRTGLAASPTSFIDIHRSRNRRLSFLEGTGVNSCSYTCRQRYYCNSYSGPRVAGTFLVTRNFQASSYTPPGGTSMHITTGTVTKTQEPNSEGLTTLERVLLGLGIFAGTALLGLGIGAVIGAAASGITAGAAALAGLGIGAGVGGVAGLIAGLVS